MPVYEIVDGRPDHAAALAGLCETHTAAGTAGPFTYSADEFFRLLTSGRAVVKVAVCNGDPVGVLVAFDMVVYHLLDFLLVHEDFRRCGVATALMAAVPVTWWKCRSVEAYSRIGSPGAEDCLSAAGFTPHFYDWVRWVKPVAPGDTAAGGELDDS